MKYLIVILGLLLPSCSSVKRVDVLHDTCQPRKEVKGVSNCVLFDQ